MEMITKNDKLSAMQVLEKCLGKDPAELIAQFMRDLKVLDSKNNTILQYSDGGLAHHSILCHFEFGYHTIKCPYSGQVFQVTHNNPDSYMHELETAEIISRLCQNAIDTECWAAENDLKAMLTEGETDKQKEDRKKEDLERSVGRAIALNVEHRLSIGTNEEEARARAEFEACFGVFQTNPSTLNIPLAEDDILVEDIPELIDPSIGDWILVVPETHILH